MKIYLDPGPSGNILSTVAVGADYLAEWKKYSLPSWLSYCKRHDLGLVVFENEIDSIDNPNRKKSNWHKLLIGRELLKINRINVSNICYLDTDILISPLAPNVFDFHDSRKISVVSQVNHLPQPLHLTLRRIAFLRHTHLSDKYPLDSSLFMRPAEIFQYHGFEPKDDYFCTGVLVFNVVHHSSLLNEWYERYSPKFHTITNGGEEPCLNYELQAYGILNLLPYEFQALWVYEAAWRYPFLFSYGLHDQQLIRECIEASLYSNYFLHFAGSWDECQMWKVGGVFGEPYKSDELERYQRYLEIPVTGKPQGMIRPS